MGVAAAEAHVAMYQRRTGVVLASEVLKPAWTPRVAEVGTGSWNGSGWRGGMTSALPAKLPRKLRARGAVLIQDATK
jgi:hypothetical protein